MKNVFLSCVALCNVCKIYSSCDCSVKSFNKDFLLKNFGLKEEDIFPRFTIKAYALEDYIKSFVNNDFKNCLTEEEKKDESKIDEYRKDFTFICCCSLKGATKADDCEVKLYFVRKFNSTKFKPEGFKKHTVTFVNEKKNKVKDAVFSFLKEYGECIFFHNLGEFIQKQEDVMKKGGSYSLDFYTFKKKKKS